MDPLEFRLKNLKDERQRAVLIAAAEKFGWGKRKAPDGRGYGISLGFEKNAYVGCCAEATMEGGRPKIIRVVEAFECGAVVNPDHLRNQVEGAVIMAIGGALFEQIRFADGKILNPHVLPLPRAAIQRCPRRLRPCSWIARICPQPAQAKRRSSASRRQLGMRCSR